jgi:hypothetical protein
MSWLLEHDGSWDFCFGKVCYGIMAQKWFACPRMV